MGQADDADDARGLSGYPAAPMDRRTRRNLIERLRADAERIASNFGLELLATVHWVAREGATSEEDVIADTYAWGERKQQFSRQQILLARRVLAERGWIESAGA